MNFFKNRTVVGVICIVLSLLICFGITPLFNKGISQKTEIVRVAKEIIAGDEITKDMVQTVEVGGYNLPENVIKNQDTVVGSFALADMSVGDYILNTKLSETPAAENAYLYNLDGRRQAISITIKTFANGLSGKLQSGDIVSVIAPDYRKQGATVIPPELKYVEVISVTASSGYDANTGEQEENIDERELPSTVTFLVTPQQGNILAELEENGELHLSLVYRGIPENTNKFLDMQAKILEELYPTETENDKSQNVSKEPQNPGLNNSKIAEIEDKEVNKDSEDSETGGNNTDSMED
jgi:pilus assembly protein CpaB